MQLVVPQNFRISGSGSYLPRRQLAAEELDRRCGMAEGWCRQHVGVLTRHECMLPETMISMGAEAIRLAMEDAGVHWHEIDMLIDCSTSQFRPIPCNAAHFQQSFGSAAAAVPCFDIHSSCLGSLVAIQLLNGLFGQGVCRNAILVASESGVGGVNYDEPESACLIGDGAAALVLSQSPSPSVLGYSHQTFAEHLELCRVEGGGHHLPVFQYTAEREAEYRFHMNGPAVFRVALQRLKPMVTSLIDEWKSQTNKSSPQIHFVPHQASPRALEAVRRMLNVDADYFHRRVTSVGNMVAASIPFMIDSVRRDDRIKLGDSLLALGTSAGYSQAALLFEL